MTARVIHGDCTAVLCDDRKGKAMPPHKEFYKVQQVEAYGAAWCLVGTARGTVIAAFADRENALRAADAINGAGVLPVLGSAAVSRHGIGDAVRKKSGSAWHGRVVGFYSTALTPVGCAVESAYEPGSVQIYPEAALEEWDGIPLCPTPPRSA